MNISRTGVTVMIGFMLVLLILGLIDSVSAITAKIGNGRMILRGNTGDEIEKYVKVINENEDEVNIKLFASGDLKEFIDIKDEEFLLEAGEEKKAYFTIKFGKAGTTESRVNVKFTPVNGKNGAGISSTVIVIADGEDIENSLFDWFDDGENEEDKKNNFENGSEISSITGAVVAEKSWDNSKVLLALLSTLVIFVLFLVILILYSVNNKKVKAKSKKDGRK